MAREAWQDTVLRVAESDIIKVTFSMYTHTHTHRIHTGYIYTHTYIYAYVIDGVVHYITVKKNKILPFVTIWMHVMDILPSGISQTEEGRCGVVSFTCGIQKLQ